MFCERLQEVLDKHNLTSYRLAKISGVSEAALSRYLTRDESQKRRPTFDNVARIATSLNISLDFFNEYEQDYINYNELFAKNARVNDEQITLIVPKSSKEYKILRDKIESFEEKLYPKNKRKESKDNAKIKVRDV